MHVIKPVEWIVSGFVRLAPSQFETWYQTQDVTSCSINILFIETKIWSDTLSRIPKQQNTDGITKAFTEFHLQ